MDMVAFVLIALLSAAPHQRLYSSFLSSEKSLFREFDAYPIDGIIIHRPRPSPHPCNPVIRGNP